MTRRRDSAPTEALSRREGRGRVSSKHRTEKLLSILTSLSWLLGWRLGTVPPSGTPMDHHQEASHPSNPRCFAKRKSGVTCSSTLRSSTTRTMWLLRTTIRRYRPRTTSQSAEARRLARLLMREPEQLAVTRSTRLRSSDHSATQATSQALLLRRKRSCYSARSARLTISRMHRSRSAKSST